MRDAAAPPRNPVRPAVEGGRHVLAWDDVRLEIDAATGGRVTALRLGGREPALRSGGGRRQLRVDVLAQPADRLGLAAARRDRSRALSRGDRSRRAIVHAQRDQPGARRVRREALRGRRRPRRRDVRLRHPQPRRGGRCGSRPGRSRASRRAGCRLFPTGTGPFTLSAVEPGRARGARRHLVRVRRRRRDRPPEAVRRRPRGLAGARRRRRAAGEDVRDRAARRAGAGRGADRDLRDARAHLRRGRGAGRVRGRSRPAQRSPGAWSGWSAGCPPRFRARSAARRCSTSSAASSRPTAPPRAG